MRYINLHYLSIYYLSNGLPVDYLTRSCTSVSQPPTGYLRAVPSVCQPSTGWC